ncbi:MAG TPA: RcpC/CpaB family pilus assembly protein [Solirubrobacterales bacterium]|nr:RcpC/CpaB family pilus assembly protein [Solirubrobacterales bacterium]
MRRRARAISFAVAAAVCAGLAASAAGGAGTALDAQLGELRPAVVTTATLRARRPVSPEVLADSVAVRRVPERFLPPDVLSAPAQLVGRAPVSEIPADSYVLASQLRAGGPPRRGPSARLAPGTRPVEIAVSGAGALASSEPSGGRVDVVVTTEGGPAGGPGRTYVAARAVELIDLTATGAEGGADTLPGPALDTWTATLALTRAQALRLIHAESFARSVRLLAR